MDLEEQKVALLLTMDPLGIYVTLDGFRAYACAYGRLVKITGINFNRMTRDETREYVSTAIRLHTMNWPEASGKARRHG